MHPIKNLGTLLASIYLATSAQGAEVGVQIQTDSPSPERSIATVQVLPHYYSFPDDLAPEAAGLFAKWTFEDAVATGPYADSVNLANNLSATGAATTAGGSVSRALSLNGSSYVSGTLPNIGSDARRFTVSLWFKPGVSGEAIQTLFRMDNYFATNPAGVVRGQPFLIEYSSSGTISLRSAPLDGGVLTSAINTYSWTASDTSTDKFYLNFAAPTLTGATANNWHHLVVVCDGPASNVNSSQGGPFSVYLDTPPTTAINSVNPQRLSTGASINYATNDLTSAPDFGGLTAKLRQKKVYLGFGVDSPASCYFKGQIDRARIYNVALPSAQIIRLMTQDIDEDTQTDRTEVNAGSDPLDPLSPVAVPAVDDDHGLPSALLAKAKLGKWDFEKFNGLGNVPNLKNTSGTNGDLAPVGANLDNGHGMPSISARFNGQSLMKTTDPLDWGSVGDYSSSFWMRCEPGTVSATGRTVLWSLNAVHGDTPTRLMFTLREWQNKECFELISQSTPAVGVGGLSWFSPTRLGVADGGWYHVTLTRTGGSVYKLYVNGLPIAEPLLTGYSYWQSQSLAGANKQLEVGGASSYLPGYGGLFGNIDRLRFWGVGLTAADATSLYLQDYDLDSIPDFTEIMDDSLNPLVGNTPSTVDALWDQVGIPADALTGLVAHWNFESFRYATDGRYFENQQSPPVLQLKPNSGVSLSNSEGIASYYAAFQGAGAASVALGNLLANKESFAVAGWLKLKMGVIVDAPNVPTPLWTIGDYDSAASSTDSLRLYAIDLGAYTQVFLCNYNPANGAIGPQATRWVVPRNARLDDEDWHHLVLQREAVGSTRTFELYLDTVKLGKMAVSGYSDVSTTGFTNTSADGTVFSVGVGLIANKQYAFNGGWDRLRIYDVALSASLIDSLYRQDADLDGASDHDEIGVLGRSPIEGTDSGVAIPPGLDLTKIDLNGVPKSLTDSADLLGMWDFETLVDRNTGFQAYTGHGGAMIPKGAPRDVGIDLGNGMPSKSAFVKNGAFLTTGAAPLSGKGEFSTSFWIKTSPALLDSQPLGFSMLSLEDLIKVGTSNTLTLRVRNAGASQAIIVQPFSTQNGVLNFGLGGAAWSLVDRRIDDGGWHHVTWVRHRTGSVIYFDGKLMDREVGGGNELVSTLAAGAEPQIIVGRTSSKAPELAMDGNIDRLRVYGRALTPDEILSLYNQDFDGDGFSDIYELGRFGYDPLKGPQASDDAQVQINWDDDIGLTGSTSLESNLAGAWNFESAVGRAPGDSGNSIRFPAERPEGVANAIADGGVERDMEAGMLSKSLSLSADGYLSMPAEILGENGDNLTASLWIRMSKDEITNQSKALEAYPAVGLGTAKLEEKIALLTFGRSKDDLPKVIVSVDYQGQLVAESNFTRTFTAGSGYTSTPLGRWHSPAKLDDGRWHHLVINIKSSESNIWVDDFNAETINAQPAGSFPGYGSILTENHPYFWIGFRRNSLLNTDNLLASQLPYKGFTGLIDRIRIYTRSLTVGEIGNLYGQDRDGDTIPDVTEANNLLLNPYNAQVVEPARDYDGDGLTNAEEATLGTSWWRPDSDGDWLWDGWEGKYSHTPVIFDPLSNNRDQRDLDHDGDTLTGIQEFGLGTNPYSVNTDGDSADDNAEYIAGSDPLDSFSLPGGGPTNPGMTTLFHLPGGTYSSSAGGGGGDPSYSFNGQDATGPRYRKIALNGRPMADQAPENEGETDHNEEETYVDAYSLGLHHDTSVIYVPVPASDLTLQVTLSLQEESWNNRSGIRPLENLTSPFGPCWSSNICAYVEESTEVGGDVDVGATLPPKYNYSAVDEDGRTLKFGSYDGASIFAYPSSLSDRKNYQHELRRKSLNQLVLKKKFGTTLTYERVILDQAHYANRAGQNSSFILHRYYRLISVEDRYGNQLRYVYPAAPAQSLIPARIVDTKRPDLKIDITVDPANPGRVLSVKDPRGYVHDFNYVTKTIPNGALSETPEVRMLSGITDPLGKTTAYAYEAKFESDYSTPSAPTFYFCINLTGIANKRGVASSIVYKADDAKFSSTLQSSLRTYKRIYGLPRLVKMVRSATSAPSGMAGNNGVEQVAEFVREGDIRWIYDENGVIITNGGSQMVRTNEWSTAVTNGVGNVTRYTFRDLDAVLADTNTYGTATSLNWLIYYLEMDITHPDSIGTEVYKFNLSSGLSLRETLDICGNSTFYDYNDSWGGFSLVPSRFRNLALFSKWSDPSVKIDAKGRRESYSYSPHFRVMSSNIDVHGTRRDNEVDLLGRRTSMTVTGSDGKPLSVEEYSYGDGRFPSFMTRKVTKAFESNSQQSWETDLAVLYEADSKGRIGSQAVDMNGNGTIDPGVDLITSNEYDKNGNKISSTDARGYTTNFTYDPLNRVSVVTYPPADGAARDQRRSKITLYDPNGNKHAEINENGVASIRLYDALNRVSNEIKDMDGVNLPVFNSESNIEGDTYYELAAEGKTSGEDLVNSYIYNDVNSVVFKTDSRGITVGTVYDAIERPLSVWNNFVEGDTEASFTAGLDKSLTVFSYNKDANTGGSIFSGDGFKPTTTIRKKAVLMAPSQYADVTLTSAYDKVYRPVEEKTEYQPGSFVTTVTSYDDTLYQLKRTVASGETYAQTSFVQFDGLGRETETVADFGAGKLNASTRKFYSSTGLVYKTIDPLGRENETDYDAAGRPSKVWQPRSDLAFGDPGYGKVERSIGLGDEITGSPVSTNFYDPNGNVTALINPRGKETNYTYDARNRKLTEELPAIDADGDPATSGTARPISTTFYDGVGNVTDQQNIRGDWTRMFYDQADRVKFQRVNPSTGNPSTAPSPTANLAFDIVTAKTYDKGGNVMSVRDGNGNITRNAYDGLGRLVVTATDPSDGDPSDPNAPGYSLAVHQGGTSTEIVVSNIYDDAGDLIQVTDGKGQKTGFRYDGLGRKTFTIWDPGTPLARNEESRFNGVYQTARLDPGGKETDYGYDGLYRNTTVTYLGRTADNRTNEYDLGGNLTSVTYTSEAAERNVTQSFDALNRVRTELSNGQVHSYSYDKAGNRLTTVYQGGRYISSSYDSLNRLETATEKDSEAAVPFRLTRYGYDLAGNIVRKQLPNGVLSLVSYDSLNRRLLVEDQVVSTAAVISSFNYSQSAGSDLPNGYDKAGSVLRVQETYTNASVKNRIVTNINDHVYRLKTETLNETGAGGDLTVTDYTYDKANNRTGKAKTVNGSLLPADNLVFTFGDGTNGRNSNQLAGYGPDGGAQTHTFTYDPNGNRKGLTTAGHTDDYSYDYENRLVSLDFQTGANASRHGVYAYTYDHRSRRVLRNEAGAGGVSTRVSFSGGTSVQEREGTTVVRQYIRGSDYGGGIGGVLYTYDASSVSLFDHYNSRGDVIGQTNAAAAVTWQASYEAFGTRVREGGTNPHPQKANTKDEDPTGLLNEGFRYRDLESGVFITRDPTGFVDGPNVYTYVRQNPWTSFDPDGLKTISDYEKEIVPLREKAAAKDAAATAKGYKGLRWGAASGWKERGRIKTAQEKIAKIENTARDMERSLRAQTGSLDERYLDDDDEGFRSFNAWNLARLSPGWEIADHAVNKEYGAAATAFGRDVIVTIVGGKLIKMAAGGAAAAEVAAAKGPVIIGENMSRVNTYAGKVGGETIDGWLAGRKWSQSLNDEFVGTMKAQGRQIQDIGPDFGRRLQNRIDPNLGRPPSSVYGGERQSLLDYGNYHQLYERAGKYQGGVPGFDN